MRFYLLIFFFLTESGNLKVKLLHDEIKALNGINVGGASKVSFDRRVFRDVAQSNFDESL